ncbi:MAG: L-seryl-tRNA(Sec) selenium transferase [Synergistaceae bacterium]|jgi:L-seryl-tRNA(Ser) seleniumtransferase|nr:L-seryl-tRNA(Sec) selenium transferase [Synergistaceae bacterium]
MVDDIEQKMRSIPGMDVLLGKEWTVCWQKRLGRETVKRVFNEELSRIRRALLDGKDADVSAETLDRTLAALLAAAERRRLRPVINATGVVVHTNLGRSRLADEALRSVEDVAGGYSNLEYDLDEGVRGHRNAHVEEILCALVGAEAALVVNNNAGAVLLCLSALARGTEVVVSRGELVEIGGSFRIPDIMEFSGAELVETGTTNRTHLKDYARAVTERTSMLLKVHPSNFRMEGFTSAPERSELAALAHERGLIFMEDAGSGLLIQGRALGADFAEETDVKTCLSEGVDLVTFSGDKMLGGPQIGVIAGKKALVDRLRGHPALRALRVDKMTLAAFETTMRLYMRGDYDAIPTLAMLRRTQESMKAQATRLAGKLRRAVLPAKAASSVAPSVASSTAGTHVAISVAAVEDAVGGGSCPALPLPGWGVSIALHRRGGSPSGGSPNGGSPRYGSGRLQETLRARELPILCGAREDMLMIHVRTLRPEDESEIVRAFKELNFEDWDSKRGSRDEGRVMKEENEERK